MRLVCDKCSSIYTIEDSLVGDRDFTVSCKQCGTPIVVRKARQVSSLPPPSATALESSRAPLARPQRRLPPPGEEAWFISIESSEEGPFNALELARMLEQERISWATPVWREGMKAWRPARRDASLVTAVAGARGYAGDTMRLTSSRSFLAPDDTIIEMAPGLLPEAAAVYGHSPSQPPSEDLLSSNSETKALDMRAALERERPSNRPAAWNSPQNEAFRQHLGLDDSHDRSPVSQFGAATMADAFRSAPSLIHSQNLSSTELSLTTSRPPEGEAWSTRAQSFWAVAAMAFAGGVLVAALWARMIGPTSAAPKPSKPQAPSASSTTTERRPAAASKEAPTNVPHAAPAQPPQTTTPTPLPTSGVATAIAPQSPAFAAPTTQGAAPVAQGAGLVTRELPNPDELRDAVREVAVDVKRCVVNPARGVDVDLYLDGTTGRVRDVLVRSPQLPPGRVACINHALAKLQVGPFTRPELKLMHKFSW